MRIAAAASLAAFAAASFAVAQPAAQPNDAQIAHIAYTAGLIDIATAKQALAKSKNPKVRAFAEEMVRDHGAVNDKALALVKKLGVTPQDNPTSKSLAEMKARSAPTRPSSAATPSTSPTRRTRSPTIRWSTTRSSRP